MAASPQPCRPLSLSADHSDVSSSEDGREDPNVKTKRNRWVSLSSPPPRVFPCRCGGTAWLSLFTAGRRGWGARSPLVTAGCLRPSGRCLGGSSTSGRGQRPPSLARALGWGGGGQAPPAGVPALSGLLCDSGESPALVLGFSSAKRGGRRSPGARMRRRELTAQVRVAPLFVVAAAPVGGKAALLRDPSPQRPGPCPLPTESPAKGENSGSVCLRSPGGQGEGSIWPPGTRSWQRRVRVSLKATVRPLLEPAWRRVSLRNWPSSGPQGRVPTAAGIRSLPPAWDPRPGAGV